ncbi:hypothetical protein CN090_04165 [Sinorhizobium meliloti]|uniref:hypothetical protein n=1 Tax=Rhizobium meliloti TaxID=382 RepID=UPI000FD73722|nr:hypothetical protein [Sinorhizobium meliloti]RVO55122.1 hypothetical protein CN090_04165 [Sinorhizobium meliloti]
MRPTTQAISAPKPPGKGVIPSHPKQYNPDPTTTFGPLDKYVPANDNVPDYNGMPLEEWKAVLRKDVAERFGPTPDDLVPAGDEAFVPTAQQPARIEDRGPFIQVWPNHQFFPFDPRPQEVFIESIAHGLANICRYSGAVEKTYSVAEHSVHTARWLRFRYGVTSALCALLHDSPEALSGFGDVGRPVKGKVPFIGETEDNIYRLAVAPRFGLPLVLPPEVHEADSRIIADEVAANLAPMDWHARYSDPLGVNIRCWYPAQAEEEFLATFGALMDCRARGME